jgi:hypothetical protein
MMNLQQTRDSRLGSPSFHGRPPEEAKENLGRLILNLSKFLFPQRLLATSIADPWDASLVIFLLLAR